MVGDVLVMLMTYPINRSTFSQGISEPRQDLFLSESMWGLKIGRFFLVDGV